MKHALLILLLCIALCACSSGQAKKSSSPVESITPLAKNSYEEWNEEAKEDIRLYPKFGNAVKTVDQKKADQLLIDDYAQEQGSRHKASELLVKLGFDYFYKGETLYIHHNQKSRLYMYTKN